MTRTRVLCWSVIVAALLATSVVAITLFRAMILLGYVMCSVVEISGGNDLEAFAYGFAISILSFSVVVLGRVLAQEFCFTPLSWLRKKAEAEEKIRAEKLTQEVRAEITRDAEVVNVLESLTLRFKGGVAVLFGTDGHGNSYSVPAPEWIIQSRPAANGNIVHELRQRKFHDGQWVRVLKDSGGPLQPGVLGQVDYTGGYLGVRVREGGTAYGISSDRLELARPRKGEIWFYSVCPTHVTTYSSPRPFNFDVEPGSIYVKWVGCCLIPVNYGRSWAVDPLREPSK